MMLSPYEAAVSQPFMVIDDCIDAALAAAVRARKTAWEYRQRGDFAQYRKKVADAWDWRRRAKLWKQEIAE